MHPFLVSEGSVMPAIAMPPAVSAASGQRPLPFNEMRGADGIQPSYQPLDRWLRSTDAGLLERKRREADRTFRTRGITFAVYGDTSGAERLIPFDVIPRILSGKEWATVSAGCIQRVKALNMFLSDIYGKREILRAGVIPEQEVLGNKLYSDVAAGITMPNGVHSLISGVDVVRTGPDQWYVLEDNLRTPSGVSYMLEDRAAMMRLFPQFFTGQKVRPIEHYPDLLYKALCDAMPVHADAPKVIVLTPGAANSAYFEHAYLANRMGVRLCEGQDLVVEQDKVYVRTTRGLEQINVIYRRIDDDYLDPAAFRPDSALGVRGLVAAAKAGNVTIINAVGNGVADDKATYLHVPAMIKFYLSEEPIIHNVPTYRLSDPSERAYVLEHLHELVVKEVHGSGGYGMLVGPTSTAAERVAYRERILADPSDFIAQPTLALSTCPTFVAQGIAPRHVDLRPYVLAGKTIELVPGALTRVALKEGSLVVNSSQGGGTKDTWVVD
jgi:uncharacterized circularly permuted ATP-grasp superfamily protein